MLYESFRTPGYQFLTRPTTAIFPKCAKLLFEQSSTSHYPGSPPPNTCVSMENLRIFGAWEARSFIFWAIFGNMKNLNFHENCDLDFRPVGNSILSKIWGWYSGNPKKNNKSDGVNIYCFISESFGIYFLNNFKKSEKNFFLQNSHLTFLTAQSGF